MKFATKRAERLYTILFMFLISLFCISILTAVYLASRDRIRNNETLASKRALLTAARMPVPDDLRTLDEIFKNQVSEYTNVPGSRIFAVRQGASSDPASGRRRILGFVFEGRGTGLWGEIRAWVGVSPDRKQLMAVAITAHSETPGLGARIDEPWFGRQFSGKASPLVARPEKTRSAIQTEFDGITGATATIEGVRGMLNSILSNAPAAVNLIIRFDAELSNAVSMHDSNAAALPALPAKEVQP